MRVFVTGGAGYIGSVCVKQLLDNDHEVITIDNLSTGHRKAVDTRALLIEADLAERALLFLTLQAFKPHAVLHFASNTLVPLSMQEPGKYLGDNITNAVNLLDACVSANVYNFVFSSSCAIFGTPSTEIITEDLPKNPVNPYGESKLIVERILYWYEQVHNIQYTCFRYFNAAGSTRESGQASPNETHIVPNIMKVALNQLPVLEIYGTDYVTPDGTCIRDFVHVSDLVQAHLLALCTKKSSAYNLGSGTGYSVQEVVQTAREVTHHILPTVNRPRRAGDPAKLVADSTKISKELGWKPTSTLEQIIQTAWDWHKANPNGYK